MTWIVVADKLCARIFEIEADGLGDLTKIETLFHTTAPGPARLPSWMIPGPPPGEAGRAPPARQTDDVFAEEIATLLDRDFRAGRYMRLILVAPPRFLGLIRRRLPAGLRRCVVQEIDKDLTRWRADEIRNHLPEPLPNF